MKSDSEIGMEQLANDMLHYTEQPDISYRTTAIARLHAVPVEPLEALSEKWESSGMVEDEACAMELREVMEDYQND